MKPQLLSSETVGSRPSLVVPQRRVAAKYQRGPRDRVGIPNSTCDRGTLDPKCLPCRSQRTDVVQLSYADFLVVRNPTVL